MDNIKPESGHWVGWNTSNGLWWYKILEVRNYHVHHDGPSLLITSSGYHIWHSIEILKLPYVMLAKDDKEKLFMDLKHNVG